jgi:hypothetical protein
LPVREGPPQPAPPPKDPRQSDGRLTVEKGWGIWTGIAAIAAIVFLGVLFVMPWADRPERSPTTTVEKTSPAPTSGPIGKQ